MAEFHKSNEIELIHLLFRGDSKSCEDEYIVEFKNNKLIATTVPVLKFNFKNLPQLAELLKDANHGLIITSPRVVEALVRAAKLVDDDNLKRFNSDLVFVVGEKSGREFEARLGSKYNIKSSHTGNSRALAEYIRTFCNNSIRFSPINILYPKGSRSDNLIEDALADECKINVKSVVVYETNSIDDISAILIQQLRKLNRPDGPLKLLINMIFFSPSGVEGILKVNQDQFLDQLQCIFPNRKVEFRYSSIGKTTEAALLQNNLKVSCVSEKPSPSSLVKSILKSSFS